jgi:hypothetical protein
MTCWVLIRIQTYFAVKDFQFIFDAPPAQPSATTQLEDILGWSVWCAMELALKDIVFDECDEGLKVGCLDYRVRGKYNGPRYVPLALFPHLRGSPLRKFPAKATGVAAVGQIKWNIRVWICERLVGDRSHLCAIVQLLPLSAM